MDPSDYVEVIRVSGGVAKVRSWDEFKRLAIKLRPKSIAYNIEQSVPARNLTSLRLMLPGPGVVYVFLDFPKGEKLRETGISLHKDKKGNIYLEDKDIVNFVKKQLSREDVIVCSYFTI